MWFGQSTGIGDTTIREPSHAGSWYSGDASRLRSEVDGWMKTASASDDLAAKSVPKGRIRAVIGPHAGFRYSGPTAGYSYAPVVKAVAEGVNRVILIGPSHTAHLPNCRVSTYRQYETPLGRVEVDLDAVQQLKETPGRVFGTLNGETETAEHSLEMHVPFIQSAFDHGRAPLKIVPILAGSLSAAQEAEAGKALAPLLSDPRTIIAVSTDFCHWGRRFGYDFYDPSWGATPSEAIRRLDHLGIDAIRTLDPAKYRDYQDKYSNTICGRHAVAAMLHALQATGEAGSMEAQFPKYAQSNAAESMRDSSVSYSAGVVRAV